jgi:nitrile hydratase
MNGIHDLGGMHGFGRVVVERDEPVFHAPWEGRVFAMAAFALAAGVANGDAFRHAIERMDPVAYLTAGYYGRWLAALERLLLERGVLSADEIAARTRGRGRRPRRAPARAVALAPPARLGARRRLVVAPRFAVGAPVRARNLNPAGHTRLPRYVRGKRGTVVQVTGGWVFPDTHAHGLGEDPQHVYCVRFEAPELWGDAAEPGTAVHVDLFERYLDPA